METLSSPTSEVRRSSRLTGKTKPIYTDTNQLNDKNALARFRARPSKKIKSPKKENMIVPSTSVTKKRGRPVAGTVNKTGTGTKNGEVVSTRVKKEKKKSGTPKKPSQMKKKPKLDSSFKFPILTGMIYDYEDNNKNQNESENENGVIKSSQTRVKETLRAFNTNYLHCVQEEQRRVQDIEEEKASKEEDAKNNEANEGGEEEEMKRPSKRPDLKAISKMLEDGTVINHVKRLGHVPGVEVGKIFCSRGEMVVVGLHSHWLNGIDYMGKEYQQVYSEYRFPLAVCICLSGQYEDDKDNMYNVTYTGQGGHDLLGNKTQIADQKLERGNLALANSFECKTPVRLIRKHSSESSYTRSVYTYDGLYTVEKYWPARGARDYIVYKYSLRRLESQTPITSSQVKFCRQGVPQSWDDLEGKVCNDISGGQENLPIPASNTVDADPLPPTGYVYSSTLQIPSDLQMPKIVSGCNCIGDCSESRDCPCAKLNESDFAYVRAGGVAKLMEARSVVFECGDGCNCNSCCINRTSQQGLKYRLEVYKTRNKGWAVRSWDAIPAGAPICEYTGILRRNEDVDANRLDNIYLFDIDCLETMKGIDGREKRQGPVVMTNDDESCVEYCIDGGKVGNVSRFINHSCQPNLFVQSVMSSHRDFKLAKVMLFAADNIPPLQELCYDYGYALDSVVGPDGKVQKLKCHCGAKDCRKRLH